MSAEQKFRIGACHGAEWLHKQARKMAREDKPATEISATLSDLVQVLLDWREGQVEMPEGNPWEWRSEVLSGYISARKAEWLGLE
ncbi:MAG: hypothetical protein INR62_02615 [Rhodospirillales bacterium]|nr:hypothetical protein [Acetobacter sp.]